MGLLLGMRSPSGSRGIIRRNEKGLAPWDRPCAVLIELAVLYCLATLGSESDQQKRGKQSCLTRAIFEKCRLI